LRGGGSYSIGAHVNLSFLTGPGSLPLLRAFPCNGGRLAFLLRPAYELRCLGPPQSPRPRRAFSFQGVVVVRAASGRVWVPARLDLFATRGKSPYAPKGP
jgi:hypothetical protein